MDIYSYGGIVEGDCGLESVGGTGSPRSYDEPERSYAGDTGELLDTPEKEVAHFERQINMLSEFLLKDYDDKICGSAIETAMAIITEQSEQLRNAKQDLTINLLDDD